MRPSITLPVNTPETCRYFLLKGQRKKSGGKTEKKGRRALFLYRFFYRYFSSSSKKAFVFYREPSRP